jgi:hypothetical protein
MRLAITPTDITRLSVLNWSRSFFLPFLTPSSLEESVSTSKHNSY